MTWTGAVVTFLLLCLGSPDAFAAPAQWHWWREAGPVVVTVYDQTRDKSWGRALRELTHEWNVGIEGVELIYTHDPTRSDCNTGRGAYTVVVCVQENTEENHIAETHLYHDGEHLRFAMIWMDTTRPNPAKKHLACHELGHALGLGHRGSDEKHTCMSDGYKKYAEHPDQLDFNNVNSLYAHTH